MEKRNALITYEVETTPTNKTSLTKFFGKEYEEFYPKIQKILDGQEETISGSLLKALEAEELDGSDLMILAATGLRHLFQEMALMKEFERIKNKIENFKEYMDAHCNHNCEDCHLNQCQSDEDDDFMTEGTFDTEMNTEDGEDLKSN